MTGVILAVFPLQGDLPEERIVAGGVGGIVDAMGCGTSVIRAIHALLAAGGTVAVWCSNSSARNWRHR
jgi:hypothetical protein